MNTSPSPESGNALWFVLIAVALLAILTAVVSNTSSMVEQTGSVEQARIKASAILRYTQGIEAAVQHMVMNGTSENDLDFVDIGPEHKNTHCTSDACNVFSVEGGGIAYRSAPDVMGAADFKGSWIVSAASRLNLFGCDDEDAACSDLLLLLPGISEALCIQINKLQNVPNPGGAPPVQNDIPLTPFTGTYAGTNTHVMGGDSLGEAPQIRGKSAGCVFDKSASTYIFYQMLIAR